MSECERICEQASVYACFCCGVTSDILGDDDDTDDDDDDVIG